MMLRKKMLLSSLILIVSVSLIAGGTMAWFTDKDDAGEAVFTAGTVSIEADSSTVLSQNFDPGKAVYLYGAEKGTGDLYEIDVKNGTTHMLYDTDLSMFGDIDQWSPNGLAFDNANRRLYMAVRNKGGSSQIWYYDLKQKELIKAGDVDRTIYGATFGQGYCWYIPNGTDDLYKISFESGSMVESLHKANISDRNLSFGDVVIDYRDGILYGSSSVNYQIFFKYDIEKDKFEIISKKNALDLQLAFGSDGQLYGHSSNTGKWYKVEKESGGTEPISVEGNQKFNDLASGFTSVWNPGDSEKMRYYIKNTGTKKIRIRATVTGQWYDENDQPWTPEKDNKNVVTIELCNEQGDTWLTEGGYFYYSEILEPGETAELCLIVTLDGPRTGNEYQGKTYKVTGIVEAVQASNDAPYHVWGVDLFRELSE